MWNNSRTKYIGEAVFCFATGIVFVLLLNLMIRSFSTGDESRQIPVHTANPQTDPRAEFESPQPKEALVRSDRGTLRDSVSQQQVGFG